jgi:hypothetical protein
MNRLVAGVVAMFLLLSVGQWWVAYRGRVERAESQRQACERGVLDRVVHRDIALASERGNEAVAQDQALSARTRMARAAEAKEQARGVTSYESRMPMHLRRTTAGRALPDFRCETAVSQPSVFGLLGSRQ